MSGGNKNQILVGRLVKERWRNGALSSSFVTRKKKNQAVDDGGRIQEDFFRFCCIKSEGNLTVFIQVLMMVRSQWRGKVYHSRPNYAA